MVPIKSAWIGGPTLMASMFPDVKRAEQKKCQWTVRRRMIGIKKWLVVFAAIGLASCDDPHRQRLRLSILARPSTRFRSQSTPLC